MHWHCANLRAGGSIHSSTSLSSVVKGPGREKLNGCRLTVKEWLPGGMGFVVLNTTWLAKAPRAPSKSTFSVPVPMMLVMNSCTLAVSSVVAITSIVNK